MAARDIERVLDGPAGYAIAIAAAVVGVFVIFEFIKAQTPNVIAPLNNFDANVGLGGFDSWVSSLFQAPQ